MCVDVGVSLCPCQLKHVRADPSSVSPASHPAAVCEFQTSGSVFGAVPSEYPPWPSLFYLFIFFFDVWHRILSGWSAGRNLRLCADVDLDTKGILLLSGSHYVTLQRRDQVCGRTVSGPVPIPFGPCFRGNSGRLSEKWSVVEIRNDDRNPSVCIWRSLPLCKHGLWIHGSFLCRGHDGANQAYAIICFWQTRAGLCFVPQIPSRRLPLHFPVELNTAAVDLHTTVLPHSQVHFSFHPFDTAQGVLFLLFCSTSTIFFYFLKNGTSDFLSIYSYG